MKKIYFYFLIFPLIGCSSIFESEEDRISQCEKKGISKDICYQEERADRRALLNKQKPTESTHIKEILKGIGLE